MQQPKRFQAPTLAEAYDAVRREFGDAAVILSTRKAFAPGLFGQPGRQFVEVVARVPAPPAEPAIAQKRPTLDQDAAAHDLVRSVAEAVAAAPAVAKPAATPAVKRETKRTTKREPAIAAAPAVAAEPWSQQMDEMRGMLERLLADRIDMQPHQTRTGVTRSILDRLSASDVPESLATALLADVEGATPRLTDEPAILAAVERRLVAKMAPAVTLNVTRRRAIFLVGPAGAGKTTMAVRMALELEREQELRVVIAGTDVNRAGAPQQLMAFGSVTGLETRLCYTPADLEELLADDQFDVVIVDTAGHNGMRRDRMAELNAFVQTARQRIVLLTLPATMKASDMTEAATAFASTGVDGLVLTRCDETARFGALAAVATQSGIGIAYTTHSDQVSEAPEVGNPATLAAAVVSGQWESAVAAVVAAPAVSRRTLARVG